MDRRREPLPSRVEGLPPLPDDAEATLTEGLRVLATDLPDDARARLVDHLRLLLAWTASINLTSIREPVAAVRAHVLDSLTALPILRERELDLVLDLGSGGGYPGLPLAIALPARRALLVESVGKKATFLAAAVDALRLADRVDVFAGRAEVLARDVRHRERWPAVLARGVAGLPELLELSLPLVAPGGVLVAWKRHPLDAELQAAESVRGPFGGGPLEVHDAGPAGIADHVLVVVPKIRRSPDVYPRDPALRRRGPR